MAWSKDNGHVAKVNADYAKTQGDYAKTKADYVASKESDINKFIGQQTNLQAQINNLVADGDSSPEAAQARVGTNGSSYSTLKARLDDENVKVTAQLAQKAKQIDLDTAKARMDTFVAAGATSDNAETVDIRVGADGVIDTSAGEGVRRQFTELKNSFRQHVKVFRKSTTTPVLTWEQGTINDYGVLMDSTTRIRTKLIRVKPGTVIRYSVPSSFNGTLASYKPTGEFIKFEVVPIEQAITTHEMDVRFILVGKYGTTPITTASSNIANILTYREDAIIEPVNTTINVPFMYEGALDDVSGKMVYRVRRISSDMMYIPKGITLSLNLDSTDRFFVAKHKVISGWIPYNGSYVTPEDGYYAITVGKVNDSDISVRDNIAVTLTTSIVESIKEDVVGIKETIAGIDLNPSVPNDSNDIKLTSGHYIATGGVGTTINLSLNPLSGWSCAVIPCKAGDTFVINGQGGNGGRIWTFTDSNNVCLSTAPAYELMDYGAVTAPTNATKLIVNLPEGTDAYVGSDSSLLRSFSNMSKKIKNNAIRDADIREFPPGVMAMPTLEYHTHNLPDSYNVTTKYGIHKKDDYFVVTYALNVDGSVADHPNISSTGMMEVRYKLMKYVAGVESEESFGTLAKLGTAYTDYEGKSATLTGGCGYSSSVNSMAYFSSAKTATTKLNGYANYNLMPCCSSVNISGGTVTFGTIRELTLTIDGAKGRFDMSRINGDGLYNYYTSTPPHYNGTSYIWLQPYMGGIAYLTSSNGIDWILDRKIPTTYQPDLEVACSSYSNNLIVFAARTNARVRGQIDYDNIYIGLINLSQNQVIQYRINQIKSKPFLVKTGSSILLFYMPDGYGQNECVRIELGQDSLLYFTRWFSIFKDAVQYTAVHQESVSSKNFDKMYIVGGNGDIGNGNGSAFVVLSFPTNKPRTTLDIPFMID